MQARRLSVVAALLVTAVFSQALIGEAADVASIDDGAIASAVAVPGIPLLDSVSIAQTGELTDSVRVTALAAAAAVGAPAVVGRGFSAGLTRVRRGNSIVQQSSGPGWAFPMAITALPIEAIGAVMGRRISGPISEGRIVMGATSAAVRGALAGDTIDLMAANGSIRTFTIGLIAPDDEVGGTEILLSIPQADLLGATIPTRVLIYGPRSRAGIETALQTSGLYSNSKVRIRKTWDPKDPDGTRSMAVTKSLLGEFQMDYANLTTLGWTAVDAAWKTAFLPAVARMYPTGIRSRCNNTIHADLTAALAEVQASFPSLVYTGSDALLSTTGLNVANANQYGGCSIGQARLARITQSLGSVSRHSWGQPLDVSTTANCQGCVPKMDCRIVQIFRKHNFAWGGNFLTPDGMHFEWVGEPRHTLAYPSKYCPNPVNPQIERVGSPGSADTLFADDGLIEE
jgi:hypothetical protein